MVPFAYENRANVIDLFDLSVSHVIGIFVVFIGGLGLSSLSYAAEVIYGNCVRYSFC